MGAASACSYDSTKTKNRAQSIPARRSLLPSMVLDTDWGVTESHPSDTRNGGKMKRIEAIITPSKLKDVRIALEKVGYPGLMISTVDSHGAEKGAEQKARGLTYGVDLVTKARLVLIVRDEETEKIISAIQKAAYSAHTGDGKIFVHPVDNAVRIRTSEQGDAALT